MKRDPAKLFCSRDLAGNYPVFSQRFLTTTLVKPTESCHLGAPFTEQDWVSIGNEIRKKVYRGVGNAEVHAMLTEWFPEISPSDVLSLLSES